MIKIAVVRLFPLLFSIAMGVTALSAVQDRIEVKNINGVPHVLNPAKPPNGTIALEVERIRTIDPYERPEVGIKYMQFLRGPSGEIIIYDPNQAEAHRFGPDGSYLGSLTKAGQGPGEFSPMMGYRPHFSEAGIFVFGGRKVALFDRSGKLLGDRSLRNWCEVPVDDAHFLARDSTVSENKDQVRILNLVGFDMERTENAVELFRAANVGIIRNPSGQGGFGDQWGTPNIFLEAEPQSGIVFCGLNTDYRIWIKDFRGQDLRVVEREYRNVRVSRGDVEKVLSWAPKNEGMRWMLDAYPDRFVAVFRVAVLPGGHWAVFRVTGPKEYEIDVFDRDGRYLQAFVPPAGVKMDDAQFFSTGFAVVEDAGDSFVYREYRIKNVPGIFGK